MHPCYCKTSQCFYPPYNVESTIGTGFIFSLFVTFSHHIILYENSDFPYGAKVKVTCKAYLSYLSLSSEIDFFQFWRTYFSFILMSATFWRMSNFPVSTLASTWDELSKLDQTLQLSCGTKFLERNQTLYRGTKTQRNLKYFRKRWNTANQCLFPVWLHSKGTLRFLYGMYWTVSTKTQ